MLRCVGSVALAVCLSAAVGCEKRSGPPEVQRSVDRAVNLYYSDRKDEAFQAVAAIGPPAVPVLEEGITSGRYDLPALRLMAAVCDKSVLTALGRIGQGMTKRLERQYVAAIAGIAVRDCSWEPADIRAAEQLHDLMVALIHDEELLAGMRVALIETLEYEPGRPILERIIRSSEGVTKKRAIEVLAKLGEPE